MTYDEYVALANAYLAAHPDPNYVQGASNYAYGTEATPQAQEALRREQAYIQEQMKAWEGTLTPEQMADYNKATETKDAANAKSMPLMGLAALGTVGTLGLLNPLVMGGAGFGGTLGGAGAAAAGAGTGGLTAGGATAGGTGLTLGGGAGTTLGTAGSGLLASPGAGLTLAGAAGGDAALTGGLLGGGGALMGGAGYAAPAVFSGTGTALGGALGGAAAGLGGAGLGTAGQTLGAGIGSTIGPGLEAGLGTYGLTSAIPSLTAAEIASGATVPTAAGTAAASAAPAATKGLLGSLTDALPAGALDALKAAGLIGGAIAGAKETPGDVTTQQSKTDPRVDPYIYGDNGVLKQAQDWYLANKSGVNPNMQAGWDSRIGLLTDPTFQAQIAKMKLGSQGLMSAPIAGNPWLKG